MSQIKLVVIFLCGFLGGAQCLKKCESHNPCTILKDCPHLYALIQVRPRPRENVITVRKEICGFRGVRENLVCCDGAPSTPTPKPFIIGVDTPKPKQFNPEDLLPNDVCGHPTSDDKVVGGEPAPLGAYPWVVALGYIEPRKAELTFSCAGSLINDRYVLTAAHCTHTKYLGRRRLSRIRLGDHDLKMVKDCQKTRFNLTRCAPPSRETGFEEVIMHPDFDKGEEFSNDIALIRLDESVNYRDRKAYIAPICLPASGLNVRSSAGDRDPIGAGWGFTEDLRQSDILLRVTLPLQPNEMCQTAYGDQFLPNQLCVGGLKGQDTCSGDSGGPLVLPGEQGPPFLQVGIVSYGPFPCGRPGQPGVYTNVALFRSWILGHIKP